MKTETSISPTRPKAWFDTGTILIGLLFVLISIVAGSIFYAVSNTHIEEVSTGRGLDIIQGRLERISGYRNTTAGYAIISNEGREEARVSRIPYSSELVSNFYEGNFCIYLQEHLVRTTYPSSKTDYRQHTTFEGIRDINADGSCEAFPFD